MKPKIILKGRIPSKKNNFVITVKNGRILKFPSNAYQTWHKDAKIQMQEQMPSLFNQGSGVLEGHALRIVLFAPDLRAFDLTNKAESIMDLLVDTGFMADDNYNVINKLLLEFGGLDRENPRAEIYEITE